MPSLGINGNWIVTKEYTQKGETANLERDSIMDSGKHSQSVKLKKIVIKNTYLMLFNQSISQSSLHNGLGEDCGSLGSLGLDSSSSTH